MNDKKINVILKRTMFTQGPNLVLTTRFPIFTKYLAISISIDKNTKIASVKHLCALDTQILLILTTRSLYPLANISPSAVPWQLPF